MKRRRLLSVLAGASAFSGCATGYVADDVSPTYRYEAPIVYDRPDIELSLRDGPARLGGTVAFDITNTGESGVGLGCKNPWAFQHRVDGEWQHVTWTASRYPLLCLTSVAPGGTYTERVTFSEAWMAEQGLSLQRPLSAGTYRYVIVGTEPYPALEFELRE